ncbi:MAG: Asp-tRNA(Asn)/Glu-tRNA(Gln) amidotransferase subunit GatC [Chitinophagaceae bacterium]
MVQVTNELIDHLAHLSMLQFDGDEKESIRQDLEKMIGFVEKLQELDTTGVEPLRHMSFEINKLRSDEVKGSVSREEALKNAGNHTDEFFMVPKVISR